LERRVRVDASAALGSINSAPAFGKNFNVPFAERTCLIFCEPNCSRDELRGDVLALFKRVLQNRRVHVHVSHLAAGA
jgi:hypothetical protein